MKNQFSSMLTQGATIPIRLLCSAGFAVYPYSFTPHASHPGRTCRVHNPGYPICCVVRGSQYANTALPRTPCNWGRLVA